MRVTVSEFSGLHSGGAPSSTTVFYTVVFKNVPLIPDASILRRYSDFVWLREQLLQTHPCTLVPPLPPKILLALTHERKERLGRFRKTGLVRFLCNIVNVPRMVRTACFEAFSRDCGDRTAFQERKTAAERRVRARGTGALIRVYQQLFPEALSRPADAMLRRPEAHIFKVKDFLRDLSAALVRLRGHAQSSMALWKDVCTQTFFFSRKMSEKQKMDETFASELPSIARHVSSSSSSSSLQPDLIPPAKLFSIHSEFSPSSPKKSYFVSQAWSELVSATEAETARVPTMFEALRQWGDARRANRRSQRRGLAAPVSLRSRRNTVGSMFSLSDPDISKSCTTTEYDNDDAKLAKILTRVVIFTQIPLYVHRYSIIMRKALADAARCLAVGHNMRVDTLYNAIGQTRQFGCAVERLPKSLGRYGFVPNVLCVLKESLLRTGGLSTRGIFRVSASQRDVNTWCAKINRDITSVAELVDVHVASNLIKLFFRQLPHRLFGGAHLPDAKTLDKQSVKAFSKHLQPQWKQHLFGWVLGLCTEVAVLQNLNLMSAGNLAIVFAPNFVNDTGSASSIHAARALISRAIQLKLDFEKQQKAVKTALECVVTAVVEQCEGKSFTEKCDISSTHDSDDKMINPKEKCDISSIYHSDAKIIHQTLQTSPTDRSTHRDRKLASHTQPKPNNSQARSAPPALRAMVRSTTVRRGQPVAWKFHIKPPPELNRAQTPPPELTTADAKQRIRAARSRFVRAAKAETAYRLSVVGRMSFRRQRAASTSPRAKADREAVLSSATGLYCGAARR